MSTGQGVPWSLMAKLIHTKYELSLCRCFSRIGRWGGGSCTPIKLGLLALPFVQRETTSAGCGTPSRLLGHADGATTMIYTHGLNKRGYGVAGPLDD